MKRSKKASKPVKLKTLAPKGGKARPLAKEELGKVASEKRSAFGFREIAF